MKQILWLGILSIFLISAVAAPLEITDLLNATYSGNLLNPQVPGAINFLSNGQWVGTLQLLASGYYFEKGPAITGNLTVYFAEHPDGQGYAAGNITLVINTTGGEVPLTLTMPAVTPTGTPLEHTYTFNKQGADAAEFSFVNSDGIAVDIPVYLNITNSRVLFGTGSDIDEQLFSACPAVSRQTI